MVQISVRTVFLRHAAARKIRCTNEYACDEFVTVLRVRKSAELLRAEHDPELRQDRGHERRGGRRGGLARRADGRGACVCRHVADAAGAGARSLMSWQPLDREEACCLCLCALLD